MNLIAHLPEKYLESSEHVDWQHPEVLAQARSLAGNMGSKTDIARACFIFVRDEIKHSWDHQLNPVTCRASQVLEHGTGYCYAKSHLLAALLRANEIPAGLCYQRLTLSENDPDRFCLHGLNALYLEDYGWYRIDPRGNKSGVAAEFCPPVEQLAFKTDSAGEFDFPQVRIKPLANIVTVLTRHKTFGDVAANLPDSLPDSLSLLS